MRADFFNDKEREALGEAQGERSPKTLLNIHPWKSLKKRKTIVITDPALGQAVELHEHLRSPPDLSLNDAFFCDLLWEVSAEQAPSHWWECAHCIWQCAVDSSTKPTAAVVDVTHGHLKQPHRRNQNPCQPGWIAPAAQFHPDKQRHKPQGQTN